MKTIKTLLLCNFIGLGLITPNAMHGNSNTLKNIATTGCFIAAGFGALGSIYNYLASKKYIQKLNSECSKIKSFPSSLEQFKEEITRFSDTPSDAKTVNDYATHFSNLVTKVQIFLKNYNSFIQTGPYANILNLMDKKLKEKCDISTAAIPQENHTAQETSDFFASKVKAWIQRMKANGDQTIPAIQNATRDLKKDLIAAASSIEGDDYIKSYHHQLDQGKIKLQEIADLKSEARLVFSGCCTTIFALLGISISCWQK